jgi:hypothetical protein
MGVAAARAMTALDAFFESYYRLRPVNATFTGVHAHDECLPDWSPAGLETAAGELRSLRDALAAGRADVTGPLHDVATRDLELAISVLDVQIAEHVSGHFVHRNPSLALGEAAFGLVGLMTGRFADPAVRAGSAIRRLDAMPAFLDGALGSVTGRVPDAWRARALRECDGLDALLTTGLSRWPAVEAVPPPAAERLAEAAAPARAAVARFRAWLQQQPGTRDGHAAGPELFDLLLSRGHWYDGSAGDLASRAADLLEEALARLGERARRVAPGGWSEVQERLASLHPAEDGYLAAYERTWEACRRRAEDAALVTWPDAPIRYVPIPPHTRDAAPFLYYLHYRSPAPFDRLPHHEYVVTPVDRSIDEAERHRRLRATNDSVIKLNHVVHHGAIGHHVQNAFAYAGPSAIGRVAAVDGASRIGMFQGGTMAEGWACYATDLMDEHGFLTPEESLAQQHTRARLLARAVVDIGLHRGTLSFDEGVAVYRDRVGMSEEAARGEVTKNAMFPATAVMYWLGTDAIHALRRERERAEGAGFSLRRFHDRLLAFGSIPVPLVARAWP